MFILTREAKIHKNQWFKWSLPNFQLPEKIFEKIESFKIQKLFFWEAGSDTKNTKKLLKTKKKTLTINHGKPGKQKILKTTKK